jgi:hypothetical protein
MGKWWGRDNTIGKTSENGKHGKEVLKIFPVNRPRGKPELPILSGRHGVLEIDSIGGDNPRILLLPWNEFPFTASIDAIMALCEKHLIVVVPAII